MMMTILLVMMMMMVLVAPSNDDDDTVGNDEDSSNEKLIAPLRLPVVRAREPQLLNHKDIRALQALINLVKSSTVMF